jgi:trk system potassium uptake protein TrkH
MSWIVLSAFGALPLFFSGSMSGSTPLSQYINAFFETVSGFTTTGASVIDNVEVLSKSMLIWRSFTHWVGGMGVLVFIMAFLPLSGANNLHIMKAESAGPSVSKLVPRVKTTALILYSIYFIFTLAQFILLLCGGMTVFEALCTSFGTAGTGGFGFKNDSLASYNPYIQTVVTVFMLLFSVNFSSYYLAFKGRFKEGFNTEFKIFVGIVITSITLITLNVYQISGTDLITTIKNVAFTVASIISTSGFSIVDFDLWPQFSKYILLILMFTGACAGSTCGGIKLSRILLFFKNVARELCCMLHPKQVKPVTVDKRPVDNDTARSVCIYLVCFFIVFFISMLLLSLDPAITDLETGFSATATTLNNVGPGFASVGPTCNFNFLSDFSKLLLSFNMLAGRLELFPMLLLFSPYTWKKNY